MRREKLKERDAEIKQMELDHMAKMKAIDVEEKQKDRQFMREENNKNRTLTMMTSGYNKYLDLDAFGTNTVQYITGQSLKRVLGFSEFNHTSKVNEALMQSLEAKIEESSEEVIIYEGDVASSEQCVNVDKISDLLEDVHVNTASLIEKQAIEIKEAPLSKTTRVKLPEMLKLKESQNPELHKEKDKLHYVKAANNLRTEGDVPMIDCYCCGNPLRLRSSAAHRCHNIPKSNGGDWSKENVYLCCSSCNQDMSNAMSVVEYKIELYVKLSGEDDAEQ